MRDGLKKGRTGREGMESQGPGRRDLFRWIKGFRAERRRLLLKRRVSVAVIGATGSIGRQALGIIEKAGDRFLVETLTAGTDVDALREAARKFFPRNIALAGRTGSGELIEELRLIGPGRSPNVSFGEKGLLETIERSRAEILLLALPGVAGILPAYYGVRKRRRVAIASKEAVVSAGELLIREAEGSGATIFPVDSEASAIFQCLLQVEPENVKRVILTASGGPFHDLSGEEMRRITPEMALKHPVWKMGKKVTIDSANLMNKGFELIEISRLFNIPWSKISIVIHPESTIHSMVELIDGSIIAQMAPPDMRIPIALALSFPQRLDIPGGTLEFERGLSLNMKELKVEDSRAYALSIAVMEKGGIYPTVLVSADEIAVKAFLNRKIAFPEILRVCEDVVERFDREEFSWKETNITSIMEGLKWGKNAAEESIRGRS